MPGVAVLQVAEAEHPATAAGRGLIHTWLVKVSGAVSVPHWQPAVAAQLPAKTRLKSLLPSEAAVLPGMAPGWFQVTPVSARPSVTPTFAGDPATAARSVTVVPDVSFSGQ